MTLPAIFSILNNVSIRRNICLNVRKLTRENKPLFWQKWTPDVFSYFRPPCWIMLVSLSRAPTWRLHTKLYMWNIMSNNSSTENRTDLRLGHIYLSSITCQYLDFVHWMFFYFYFDGVTVKTDNTSFCALVGLRKTGPLFYWRFHWIKDIFSHSKRHQKWPGDTAPWSCCEMETWKQIQEWMGFGHMTHGRLVKHCIGIAEVMGLNPIQAWIFQFLTEYWYLDCLCGWQRITNQFQFFFLKIVWHQTLLCTQSLFVTAKHAIIAFLLWEKSENWCHQRTERSILHLQDQDKFPLDNVCVGANNQFRFLVIGGI